jgi:hypothetical protein
MTDTLKSLILEYAVEVTGKTEEFFSSWFNEREDNFLEYILRISIPPAYTYDVSSLNHRAEGSVIL